MLEEDKKMEINRENAMALWTERYGKELLVTDYSGRDMRKSAYGDRNSKFGWNLDHILPKSQGGKDTPSNLVCCHILTNDEKADKFPVFTANGKKFEIKKVQNHYEIQPASGQEKQNQVQKPKGINFFDFNQGLAYYKECQKGQFIVYVKIYLNNLKDESLIDFISKIFDDNFDIEKTDSYYNNYEMSLVIYDNPTIKDFQEDLDNCVMVNTYLNHYFLPNGLLKSYNIYVMGYHYNYHIDLANFKEPRLSDKTDCAILINDLIRINSDAKNKEAAKEFQSRYWSTNQEQLFQYNLCYYSELAKNLDNTRKEED